ncbi:MAG: cadherin-like domain-containing protein, partial [Coriobacteriia bacterium]|nr:cadherin-like domain-containing protein [Coriobacteriia bacterium]
LITEGELVWTIQRHDGSTVTLRTQLYALGNNQYAYRLEVPHAAIALGLPPDPDGIPMPPTPRVNVHTIVTVDGQPATLLGPAPSAFTTEQILRTATHRLDLALDREATDTDGDGIPDWWEDIYGLDKQNAADAAHDANSDGTTAYQAYLRGLDPAHDTRFPILLTPEVIVYPAGTTAILLDLVDTDSSPDQVTYTLISPPAAGALTLRNAQEDPLAPDTTLVPGAQFTHADLLAGRVVYDHDGSATPPGALTVTVHDEDPEHPAFESTIGLLAFEPGNYVATNMTALEARRIRNHHSASRGFVIMDAGYLPENTALSMPSTGKADTSLDAYRAAYGDDRRALLVGGSAENLSLAGGHRDDVLMPGPGDSTLTGGAGADRFTFSHFSVGNVTLTDYTPAEGDVIDFNALPAEAGGTVHQYIQLAGTADGAELRVDLDGHGIGFNNLVVALPRFDTISADLYDLVENGSLLVGDLRLQPLLSVVATTPNASENGPVPGVFTISRRGSLAESITVNFTLTPAAANGNDYVFVPSTVTLPAGAASTTVVITPVNDGIPEQPEHVLLSLLPGAGYAIGSGSQASITIEDMRMIVEISAIVPIANKDTAASAWFELKRRDGDTGQLLVPLKISGTAKNGTDYATVNGYALLSAGQNSFYIEIKPLATATLANGAETVRISILPTERYLIGLSGSSQVIIIEREDTFADWAAREFSIVTSGVKSFAAQASAGTGITHFQRYAYGLDPHAPANDGLPRPFIREGRLVVTFRKPLTASDVTYTVTGITNLRDRAGSHVDVQQIYPEPADADPQRVFYEIGPAAQNAPNAFMEVKAIWTP